VVAAVGPFHFGGQGPQLFRYPVVEDGDGAPLLRLQPLVARGARAEEAVGGIGVVGEDASVGREQGQFLGPEAAGQLAQPGALLGRFQGGQLQAQGLQSAGRLPGDFLETGAPEAKGPVQGLFDAPVEPAVHARLQEAHGEVVDDGHGDEGEDDEGGRQAAGETRAQLPFPVGAPQVRALDDHRHRQGHGGGDVGQHEDAHPRALEAGAGAHGEEVEGGEEEGGPRQAQEELPPGAAQGASIGHRYQSLSRRQPGVM